MVWAIWSQQADPNNVNVGEYIQIKIIKNKYSLKDFLQLLNLCVSIKQWSVEEQMQ